MVDEAGPFPLKLDGLARSLHMWVHEAADQHISRDIREQGCWEAFETQLVLRYLRPGDCFFDVGANIGYYSVLAAAAVGPAGKVFAFEPEPRNFELLQKNLELNQLAAWVEAAPLALSSSTGQAELSLHPDNLGDHQLFGRQPGQALIQVEMVCGEDYFADKAVLPQMVKIDTQGAEQAVVQGLLPLLLAAGRELRMIVELTPLSLRQAGSSGAELVELLTTLELPLAIIDHIEHRLCPVTASELKQWCKNVDGYPEDAGFMNIFVGSTV